ncbi:hypothetical protein HY628_03055 [Candidatus Uhrbacteria bacterium]|nr:hypothetical protein [Candidatus Uhrbacteria bacterium]
MTKILLGAIFLVGLFGGMMLGLVWGVSLGTREVMTALSELQARQAAIQTELQILKTRQQAP